MVELNRENLANYLEDDLASRNVNWGIIESLISGGTIEEEGVDGNGYYWRWSSGLQICTVYGEYLKVLNDAWGSALYGAELGRLTFAKPFITVPYIAHGTYGGASVFVVTSGEASATQTPEYWAYRPISSTEKQAVKLSAIAVGRWK